MTLSKGLRLLAAVSAVAIASSISFHTVRADDAAKVKKAAVHAKGDVTIAAITCASPAPAGIECYTITATSLTDGKATGLLTGTLLVSTTTSTRGKHTTCFTVTNASTEVLTLGAAVADLDFGAANACITEHETKKATTFTEVVTPAAPWKSGTGSPTVGSGKETWKVTPANNTSLAGTGTVDFTGTEDE